MSAFRHLVTVLTLCWVDRVIMSRAGVNPHVNIFSSLHFACGVIRRTALLSVKASRTPAAGLHAQFSMVRTQISARYSARAVGKSGLLFKMKYVLTLIDGVQVVRAAQPRNKSIYSDK